MWAAMLSSNKGIQSCMPAALDMVCWSEGLTARSEEDPPSMAMT